MYFQHSPWTPIYSCISRSCQKSTKRFHRLPERSKLGEIKFRQGTLEPTAKLHKRDKFLKRDRKKAAFYFQTPEKRFTTRVCSNTQQKTHHSLFRLPHSSLLSRVAFDLLFIIHPSKRRTNPPLKIIIKFCTALRKINEISVMKFVEKIIIWINNNFGAFSIRKSSSFHFSLLREKMSRTKRKRKREVENHFEWKSRMRVEEQTMVRE